MSITLAENYELFLLDLNAMKLAAKLIQNELISPDVSNLRVIGLIQEAMSALNIYYMNTELKKLN